MTVCKDCAGPVSRKSTTGFCKHCIVRNLYARPEFRERRMAGIFASLGVEPPAQQNCRTCSAPLGRHSQRRVKTGLCKACFNRDPECSAKRAAGLSASVQRRLKEDADFAAKMHEKGKQLGKSGTGNLAAPAGSPARRRMAQTQSAKYRAWCPEGYWDLYQHLLRSKKLPEQHARRETLRQAESDRFAALARTNLDGAIFHLRRLAPVFRREDGFQYGMVVLSAAQLVERALQKGWRP